METLSEFFQQAYNMTASSSTLGNWTIYPSNLSLILLQSSLVNLPSHIPFNISPYSGSSLNLWLLFKTTATLMEFSQRPEFGYNSWFSFTFTGWSCQKSPQKIIDYPRKIILGGKTSLPLDCFCQTWLKWVCNLHIWSSDENDISSFICIITWSKTFIISRETFFDFELKNAALCKATPLKNAAANPVIAVNRNVFSPHIMSMTYKIQNKNVEQLRWQYFSQCQLDLLQTSAIGLLHRYDWVFPLLSFLCCLLFHQSVHHHSLQYLT